MSETILVIPDPHDQPEISKDRFVWAGRLIYDKRPDHIVHLGDGLSLDSLCKYDEGNMTSEGRRYDEDIKSFHYAMDLLDEPVAQYNERMKRNKKVQYSPNKVYCIGNHEQRILTAVNETPKLENILSLDNLKLKERGWDVHPLTNPANVCGIAFAHYFTSGIMGRPISGVNHARSLVAKTYTSSVVGHSHNRSYWEDTDVFGNKVFGMVGGCYFDHDLSYTREEDRNWAGLIMLRVEDNHVDPEFISMKRIQEEYS